MIEIVAYHDHFKDAFKALNQWWIEKYFKMEKMDYQSLDHPKEYILDKGGHILFALLNKEPVGVCALIPTSLQGYDYELAKMGVSPKAQGKGIGLLLGQAILEKAKSSGAKKIYLESSTVLGPAIFLYKKLGFKEVLGIPSPYSRCNIQMELEL
ncbi:GNAT family N-acetyltransferase [Croceitalea rosinachiae]|uniref:GNAT family N-acetyltransferase n=1 Tax=Croceitalea rosinachiae TaxID=3075596 RepID=A0ABU3AA72_9FLAO|nr:GNAT family N-acetyltransferase [Croceitalea sp. F388]MDT0607089.1 GNAT family N-acetyltransferase [Croceitalea sp. F388]